MTNRLVQAQERFMRELHAAVAASTRDYGDRLEWDDAQAALAALIEEMLRRDDDD